MCTYLCLFFFGLTILLLYYNLDQWLTVCSLPAQGVPFLLLHDPQGVTVGPEVAQLLKSHLLCGVHWVVLVPLLPSYSNQLVSSLDEFEQLEGQ